MKRSAAWSAPGRTSKGKNVPAANCKNSSKQNSGPPVAVDYSMEKTDAGWKVYNMKIEGISLIENYRNSFNTEVQKNGVDGLITALAEKNRGTQVTQK